MKTSLKMEELPVASPGELLEMQYATHRHVHGYQFGGGRDPIMFDLADMLLINAELMVRVIRAQEGRE